MKRFSPAAFARNMVGAIGIGLSVLAAGVLGFAPAVVAQTTVVDQVGVPLPGAGNAALNSENLLQSFAISGGNLYWNCYRGPGRPINGADQNWACNSPTFVPTTLSGTFNRPLNLSDARLDTGIISTSATGSGTSYGIARTAGTSYALVGAATSASAVTTKAMWEVTIAPTYVAASTLPVIVNANYTGAGTVTAASTTLTLTAYTEVGGVETAITGITAAQQFTGTAANYTFNIPSSAALAPNQHIVVEVTMLVTTSAGAATGQINGVSVTD